MSLTFGDHSQKELSKTLEELIEFVGFIEERFSVSTMPVMHRLAFACLRSLEETVATQQASKDIYFALEFMSELAKKELKAEVSLCKRKDTSGECVKIDGKFRQFEEVHALLVNVRVSEVLKFRYDKLFDAIRECAEATKACGGGASVSGSSEDGGPSEKTSRPFVKHLSVEVGAAFGGIIILIVVFFSLPLVGVSAFWSRLAIVALPASLVPFVLIWFRSWTWNRRMCFAVFFGYVGVLAISEVTFQITDGPNTRVGFAVDRFNDSPVSVLCVSLLTALFAILDFLERKKSRQG